jgi:hypothetical protein
VATPDPSDSCWDSHDWLTDLRDVPPEAAWPRLMTPPHPAAVGSYGPEAIDWIREHRGVVLRWWQRLVLVRLLEHDRDGNLVWLDSLVSTARQVGKSVALRELALWRLHSVAVFGGEQLILHTARDLSNVREVQRPARIWAKPLGYRVREANAQEEIGTADGSRWLARAFTAVYGFAVSLGLADEAWGIPMVAIEDGLEPTMAERLNSQLVLWSTAHRNCTPLVPLRRAGMLAGWAAPDTSLLVEWSAERTADISDRDAWRQASPHWSAGRARLLEAKLRRVSAGQSVDPDEDDPIESFRSQFLNVWPARRLVSGHKHEPLCDPERWAHLADLHVSAPAGVPVVVAVEDYYGLGAASAAACMLPDGRCLVWGDLHPSRGMAYHWAAAAVAGRSGSRALVGASLPLGEAASSLPEACEPEPVGTRDTYTALPLLRSLVLAGQVAHSGGDALTGQVGSVRLVPVASGGLTPAHRGVRSDLLRAAAWAVAAVAVPSAQPLDFYVY